MSQQCVTVSEVGEALRPRLRSLRALFQRKAQTPTLKRTRRRWAWSEEGGAIIEFALAMPVLLTFTFGLMEVCMACYSREMISEVAREGTRYAIVRGTTCTTPAGASCTTTTTAVNNYVTGVWPKIGGGTMNVNTSFPDTTQTPGSRVKVNVTITYPLSIPYIPASTLTMSATSVMYIVQ